METSSLRRRVASSPTSIIKSETIKKEDLISRSALLDITNDSPIVGLAMGSLSEKTASSSLVKNRVQVVKNTPGTGVDLLRGQKVEEEVEFVKNNISSGDLVAPTFVNTTEVQIFEENGTKNAPIQNDEAVKPEEEIFNPQDCLINCALQLDSPDKSEVTENSSTGSSSLTYQGNETEKSPELDSSSAWSLQVNVRVQDAEEEEEEIEEFEEDYEDESFDELCEGLSKMSVQEFIGKHTRFVYNSDDEIEAGVIVSKKNVSPSVVVLKGLPVPEGKHLRFHDEEDHE